LLQQQPKKEITVNKKKKSKYQPKQQTSVVVRQPAKRMSFRDALAQANNSRVRPPSKLEEIIHALGDDYHMFIESCCSRKVTTQALAQAIRNMGINLSYATMMKIRKQVESENKWFYEMVQDIVSKGASEPASLADEEPWEMEQRLIQ